MAARAHRREGRRKRKARTAERRRQIRERREAMAARYEERDRAARESLEPLREGERPRAVTIGAVISALVALSIVAGYALGVEVTAFDSDGIARGEERPRFAQVIAPTILLAIMAWGMWRARYWAVLGFQAMLLIAVLAASFALVQATEIGQAIGNFALIAGAGTMFYFMVKALARIQMPHRTPRQ